MSEHAPDRLWSGIEVTKIIAGTLAAVTAAVIGSFLGVAGTLIGAAVASVVGSIGTEIYQKSLHRGARRLGEIAPTFVKVPAAVGTPAVAAATEQENPAHTVVPGTNIRWGRVGLAAAALFILAIGSLSAFELIARESVAEAVGSSSSGRSTIGIPLGNDSADTPAVTPSTESSPAPADEQPTTDPADGKTAPTGEPTTDATTQPTGEPTTEPTGDTPEQTPPADTGQQQQNNEVAPDQGATE
jgi:hypothetical protein